MFELCLLLFEATKIPSRYPSCRVFSGPFYIQFGDMMRYVAPLQFPFHVWPQDNHTHAYAAETFHGFPSHRYELINLDMDPKDLIRCLEWWNQIWLDRVDLDVIGCDVEGGWSSGGTRRDGFQLGTQKLGIESPDIFELVCEDKSHCLTFGLPFLWQGMAPFNKSDFDDKNLASVRRTLADADHLDPKKGRLLLGTVTWWNWDFVSMEVWGLMDVPFRNGECDDWRLVAV